MISISTRALAGMTEDTDEALDFFRKNRLDIDGVEIAFLRGDSPHFNRPGRGLVSDENLRFIKGLGFSTMHLPFKGVFYTGTRSMVVRALASLYHRLECRVAVIHPDCVQDMETYFELSELFPGLAVENMSPDKLKGNTIGEIEEILDSCEKIGAVVDLEHCMAGGDAFPEYERRLSGRIREIHASARREENGVLKRHILLHKAGIRPCPATKNVPVVIEGRAGDATDIRNEISHMRQL